MTKLGILMILKEKEIEFSSDLYIMYKYCMIGWERKMSWGNGIIFPFASLDIEDKCIR